MRRGWRYKDFEVGTELEGSMTITDAHIMTAAGLFADFNPMHVDDSAARRSVFGRRIAHGPMTVGIMMGVLGNAVSGTGIGDLDLHARFTAPVFVGTTISYVWTVTSLTPKPKYDGGIVAFQGTCSREDGEVVAEVETKILVRNETVL